MTWLGPLWCRCCSSALVCQARHESPLNHTTVAVCFKHSQPTTTTSSLLKCVKRRLQLVLWYFLDNNCLAKINQHLLNFQLLKVKILTTKARLYIIVGNDSETKVWPTSNFWINVIPHKCYFPAICRELIGWYIFGHLNDLCQCYCLCEKVEKREFEKYLEIKTFPYVKMGLV